MDIKKWHFADFAVIIAHTVNFAGLEYPNFPQRPLLHIFFVVSSAVLVQTLSIDNKLSFIRPIDNKIKEAIIIKITRPQIKIIIIKFLKWPLSIGKI